VAERQRDLNPCFYPESNKFLLMAGLLTRFVFLKAFPSFNRTVAVLINFNTYNVLIETYSCGNSLRIPRNSLLISCENQKRCESNRTFHMEIKKLHFIIKNRHLIYTPHFFVQKKGINKIDALPKLL